MLHVPVQLECLNKLYYYYYLLMLITVNDIALKFMYTPINVLKIGQKPHQRY